MTTRQLSHSITTIGQSLKDSVQSVGLALPRCSSGNGGARPHGEGRHRGKTWASARWSLPRTSYFTALTRASRISAAKVFMNANPAWRHFFNGKPAHRYQPGKRLCQLIIVGKQLRRWRRVSGEHHALPRLSLAASPLWKGTRTPIGWVGRSAQRRGDLAGLDATVYVPLADLKFVNDAFLSWWKPICAVTPDVEFYSTSDGRGVQWIPPA